MEEFIREQIKEKPLSKKKIAVRLGVSALCGLVFAVVACLVMAFLLPALTNQGGESVVKETESESEPVVIPDTEPEPEPETEKTQTIVKELTLDDYQKLQNELYAIGNRANNSIVAITKVVSDTDWFNNSYESVGTGAGVVIADNEKELLILTERKVIEKAESITVTFINDYSVEAKLKKYDGNTGIAILSVDKKKIDANAINTVRVAEFANSNLVAKGMITIALGSPLGTSYSILTGSITSTVNEISTWDDNYTIFTTDIVSNADGSGILINLDGEVVGLVMQGYSAAGSGKTLTAVAISDVKPMLELLMKGKDVPYLGLQVVTVTGRIANQYDLPSGVYIKEVKVDSPAMEAGLQAGDVITEINGVEINTVSDYNTQVLELTPEETYKVKLMRMSGNGYSEITCTVEAGVLQ